MSRLREQVRIAKALNDFYKNTGYSDEDVRRYRIDNINSGGVPERDFLGYLAANNLNMWGKLKYPFQRGDFSKETALILDRKNKIERLYKSCRDDGFIEDVYKERDLSALFNQPPKTTVRKSVVGIALTSKGTDLIHFIGFWSIAFEKYKPVTLVITGAFGVTMLGGAGWFIANIVIPAIRTAL